MSEVEREPTNEIAVIDFRSLPAYKDAKERQQTLVSENPFIAIKDTESFDIAKKRRTTLRKGRTELQNGEKLIVSKITTFRKDVANETDTLVSITKPHEEKQQKEIERWEEVKQAKKAEAERLEQERIDKIKNNILEFKAGIKEKITKATLENIQSVQIEILEKEMDCSEFNDDFELIKEQMIELVDEKIGKLRETERVRVEKERLASDKAKMELEKKRFQELKAITYIYDGDDLAELNKEEYKAIYSKAKSEFEAIETQRKEKEKQEKEKGKLGESRRQELKKIGYEVDSNTCANMSLDVWNEFFKSKNEAYLAEQARIKAETKRAEQTKAIELKRRIEAIKAVGYSYNCDEKSFELGKVSIGLSEFEATEKANFDTVFFPECERLFKVEFERIESLKPDKVKLKDAISTKLLNPLKLTLNTSDAKSLFKNFCNDIDALVNQYLSQIEKL